MDNIDSVKIHFKTDFGLVLIKFLTYFSFVFFIIGCGMMFLSMEKNKAFPISFLSAGIIFLIVLIIERKYFLSGTTIIDITKMTLCYKNFFLKEYTFNLKDIERFTIESVINDKRVLIYNVIAQTPKRRFVIGNEDDFVVLKHKIDKLSKFINKDITEEITYAGENGKHGFRQIIKIFLPLTVIIVILNKSLLMGFNKNSKFLIVILISIVYLLYYLYMKNRRR